MGKIYLTRTVLYRGRHHAPGSVHDWPDEVADELMDKGAAEPVMEVAPGADPEQDARRRAEVLDAAARAAEAGEVTAGGAPTVAAMEKILGYGVTGAERDEAWATILKEKEPDA